VLTLQSVAQQVYNSLQGNLQIVGNTDDEWGRRIVAIAQETLGNYGLTFNLQRREYLWGLESNINISAGERVQTDITVYWSFTYDEEGLEEFKNNVQRLKIFLEELQNLPPLFPVPDEYAQHFQWCFVGFAGLRGLTDWWGRVEIHATKNWAIDDNGEIIIMERGKVNLRLINNKTVPLYFTADPNIGLLPMGGRGENEFTLEGMQYWKTVLLFSLLPSQMKKIWVGEWEDVLMMGEWRTSIGTYGNWLSGICINLSKQCLELRRVAGIKVEGMDSTTHPQRDQLIDCAMIVFILAKILNKWTKNSKSAKWWIQRVFVQQDKVILEKGRNKKRWEIPFELANNYEQLKQYVEQNILPSLVGEGGWRKVIKILHKYGDVLTQGIKEGKWVRYEDKIPQTIMQVLSGLAAAYPEYVECLFRSQEVPVYMIHIPPQYRDKVEYEDYIIFRTILPGDIYEIYAFALVNSMWKGYVKWCVARGMPINISDLISLEKEGVIGYGHYTVAIEELEEGEMEDDVEAAITYTIIQYVYKVIKDFVSQREYRLRGEIELPYGEIQKKSDGIYMKIIPQQQSFLLLSWDEARDWHKKIFEDTSELIALPSELKEKVKERVEKVLIKDRKKIVKQYLEHISALSAVRFEKKLDYYYPFVKALLEEGERIHFSSKDGKMYCELWEDRILVWHDTDYNNNWVSLIKDLTIQEEDVVWEYCMYDKTFRITQLRNISLFSSETVEIKGLSAKNIPQEQEVRKYIEHIKSMAARIQGGEYILFLKEEEDRDWLLEHMHFGVSEITVSPPTINFSICTMGVVTDNLTFNTSTGEIFVNDRKLSKKDKEKSKEVVLQSVKNILYKRFTETIEDTRGWKGILLALNNVFQDVEIDRTIEEVLCRILEDYLQGNLEISNLKYIFSRAESLLPYINTRKVDYKKIINGLKDLGQQVISKTVDRWMQGEVEPWQFEDICKAFKEAGIPVPKEITQKIIKYFEEMMGKYMQGKIRRYRITKILQALNFPRPLALYTSPINGKQYLIVNTDNVLEIACLDND